MVNRKMAVRKVLRNIVVAVTIIMVSVANGTASTNFNYQPKKPQK